MLQEAIEQRGHLLLLFPKFHCELAGVGVEYAWGRAKMNFRKKCMFTTADLYANVRQSLSRDNIPLRLMRSYARKCRDYERTYARGYDGLEAENVRKIYKSHRCALDTHWKFISMGL